MRPKANLTPDRPRCAAVLVCALLVAAGVPLLAGSGPSTDAAPVATPWKTVAASGPVEARVAGAEPAVWQEVDRGDELQPWTHVRTGKRGRTTLTRNASILIVDPNSVVELPGEGRKDMQTSVVQTTGSVLYKVDSRANPHFEVVTPYLVAGVKGTTFLVTVEKDYASVAVEHGLVEVTDMMTGHTTDLAAGESMIRHDGDVEADLVLDRRQSREARREFRKLERMDRNRPDDDGSDASAGGEATLEALVPHGDWTGTEDHDDDMDEKFVGQTIDKDDDVDELIKEMIQEGVKDGWLFDPEEDGDKDDGKVGLPPDGPTTSDPPDSLPDQNDPNGDLQFPK